MAPRRNRGPTGLVWRDKRAYFDRRHRRFRNGRLAISLRTDDPDVAFERHGCLVQLMHRGDWGVLEAIRSGDMEIVDAMKALRDGDMQSLRRLGAESPRMGPAVARFLERKRATRAAGTVTGYQFRLSSFVAEVGADLPMCDITSEEARAYLQRPKDSAKGKPWAPATQETNRVTLSAVWSMVMEEEAEELERRGVQPSIRSNPWTGLEMPEVRPTRAVFLTPGEWRTLDASMTGQAYRGFLACAFLAGLRQGEIAHLRTGVDVDLGKDAVIRVQSRKGSRPWKPKTRRGERNVPITPALTKILREHIRLGLAGARYIFHVPRKDEPLPSWAAVRWTREAYEGAGIKYGRAGDGLTLHSGRHTYASWLAQDGVSLNVVAKLLGDTLKVTSETYAHLVPDTFRAAVSYIEKRVG